MRHLLYALLFLMSCYVNAQDCEINQGDRLTISWLLLENSPVSIVEVLPETSCYINSSGEVDILRIIRILDSDRVICRYNTNINDGCEDGTLFVMNKRYLCILKDLFYLENRD